MVNWCYGIVVGGFCLQLADLGSILLLSHAKDFENGITASVPGIQHEKR